jgi:hypothetical protein
LESVLNSEKLRRKETYHSRHETCPVKAPPTRGPTTLAILNAAPIPPIKAGAFEGGTRWEIIT